MKQAQLISLVVYALIAWWHVVPYLKRLRLEQSLTFLLWFHAFRYVVLFLPVARHEGYPISDAAAFQLTVGDLSGAVLAILGLVALRFRLRLGMAIAWLLIFSTVADVLVGLHQRSIEPPRPDAAGVWWMIFVFFAPLIFISLPLMIWQLVSRLAEGTHA